MMTRYTQTMTKTIRPQRKGRLAKLWSLFFAIFMLVTLFPASALTDQGHYEERLGSLTGPDSFSLTLWTVRAFADKIGQALGDKPWQGLSPERRQATLDDFFATGGDAERLEYEIRDMVSRGGSRDDPLLVEKESALQALRRTRSEQALLVERTLEDQVQAILKHENVSLMHDGSLFLPPVFSKIIDVPHVLVISPRDHIEMKTQVSIRRTITAKEIDALEASVDKDLNVSSLVVPIGGYSTYPTMIGSYGPRDWMIGVVAHEWCHNYMTVKPLGLAYYESGEVAAMNETACSILGDDVAAAVSETYYGEPHQTRSWETVPTPVPAQGEQPKEEAQAFNPNREKRKIYLAAEEKLKAGDIAGAEQAMEEGRQYLAANGYYERKLNQAFFAFYGSYAEGPDAIRTDPIGDDLRELRRRSPTLHDFVHSVEGMRSYADLKRTLGKE
jgi:hypothetical protein